MSQNMSNDLDPGQPPHFAETGSAYANDLEDILAGDQLDLLRHLGLDSGQILQLGLLLLLLKSGDTHLQLIANHQGQTPVDMVDSPPVRRFVQVIRINECSTRCLL